MKKDQSPLSMEDRHRELLVLQRRSNKVLNAQVDDLSRAQDDLSSEITRDIAKLLDRDADPAVFRAIERAAWEVDGGREFAEQARTAASVNRYEALESKHGSFRVFKNNLDGYSAKVDDKKSALSKLQDSVGKLEERMDFIRESNRGGGGNISLENRKRIEDRGWFTDDAFFNRAARDVKAYGKKFGKTNSSGHFQPANCFDDIVRYEDEKRQIDVLKEEIDQMEVQFYQRAGQFREMRELSDFVPSVARGRTKTGDFAAALQEQLKNPRFLVALGRALPDAQGESLMQSAAEFNLRARVLDHITAFQSKVNETTRLLEGPIGIFARHAKRIDTYDGIERDVRGQALMTGYLATCAGEIDRALGSYSPDYVDGPASAERDMMMHLAMGEKIDPNYLNFVCGMDQRLSGYFNVISRNPQPDFASVLENPVSVSMRDAHFAAFLKDNRDDETVSRMGFAAGDIDRVSLETLICRYFPSSATMEDISSAIEEEAEKIKASEEAEADFKVAPEIREKGRAARMEINNAPKLSP